MKLARSMFALSLSSAVFGCSAAGPAPGASTAPDAGSDSSVAAESGAPSREPIACPPEASMFEPVVNRPPSPRQAACTDAEIAELYQDCQKSADRFEDPRCTAHRSACATCMLSESSRPAWGPIVSMVEGGAHGFVRNEPGCIDLLTGVAGCGDRIVGFADCTAVACSEDRCPSESDRSACAARAAEEGRCAKLVPDATCLTAYRAKATSCAASGEAGFRALLSAFCQAGR